MQMSEKRFVLQLVSASLAVLAGASAALAQGVPQDAAAPPIAGGGGPVGAPIAGTVQLLTSEAANAQPERDERVTVAVPAEHSTIIYTFSNRGASLVGAALQDPRFTRLAVTQVNGVPADKTKAGPIDLVSTWSPRWLPFTTVFSELGYPGVATILLRRATGGVVVAGQLEAPKDRDKLAVDRPVQVGDQLVVTAPASLARAEPYIVDSVVAGGALKPKPAFAADKVTDVVYEIRRSGEPRVLFEADPTFVRKSEAGLPLVYVWPDPAHDLSPVYIERRFDAGLSGYELRLTTVVYNFGDKDLRVQGGIRVAAWQHPETGQPSMFGGPTSILQASCQTTDGVQREAFGTLHEKAIEALQQTSRTAIHVETFVGGTTWISTDTNYFIQALVPLLGEPSGQCQVGVRDFAPGSAGAWVIWSTWLDQNVTLHGRTTGCVPAWFPTAQAQGAESCAAVFQKLGVSPDASGEEIRAAAAKLGAAGIDAIKALEGRRTLTRRFALYNGPKSTRELDQVNPELKHSVQFGWMTFVGRPLHQVLVWFHDGVQSWPLAIILLTIVLKLLTFPLTNKTYKSMQKMSALKPKLEELKLKYPDRQKFAQEQMALMKREGVNPLAGCLPMLLQVPIWVGLYGAILGSVELFHEPLGLWIQDLSAADPYYVMPIIQGILMYFQTVLTPTTAPTTGMQAKIMKYGMPILFTFFMLMLPSGLVLYIIVNTVLTIGQNLMIKRRMKAA